MIAVLQRVSRAAVRVRDVEVAAPTSITDGTCGCRGCFAAIGPGFLILLGVARGDGKGDLDYLVRKIPELRVFEDDGGKMNRSLLDTGGEALVVSQFTLLADCRRGRRPAFTGAAPPEEADRLYREFAAALAARGVITRTGRFGAMMEVELVNDGPVTIVLDSRAPGEAA